MKDRKAPNLSVIASLPGVAKSKNVSRKANLPAKMDSLHGENGRLQRDFRLLCPWKKVDTYAGGAAAPSPGTAGS
jgi:hypothetical protein